MPNSVPLVDNVRFNSEENCLRNILNNCQSESSFAKAIIIYFLLYFFYTPMVNLDLS